MRISMCESPGLSDGLGEVQYFPLSVGEQETLFLDEVGYGREARACCSHFANVQEVIMRTELTH